jgi:hypothetical protein
MGNNTPPFEPSYSICEFCAAERISEPTFYELKKLGLSPQEMDGYGAAGIHVIRISHRARLDWQRMMENPPPAKAEAVQQLRLKMQQKSRHAAAKSVQSEKHVSKSTGTPRRGRCR